MDGIDRIHLSQEQWESMYAHVLKCLPNEACGILGGLGERVLEVIHVTNELQSPYRYRMEPSEQLAAMQRFDEKGLEMFGIYHSHVQGKGEPSPTDLKESYYPRVAYLVWFPVGGGWNCRAFRLIAGDTTEIPLIVETE